MPEPSAPPPPPPSMPPPNYQPGGSAMKTYMPPPMAQPPAGYPQSWQQQPWQPAPQPSVGAGWGAVGVLSQFGGSAAWACGVGLLTIVVPLFFGRVFFFLPIVAIIAGVRAIQQGRLIGGIVGIVLGAIGGILTLFGLFG